MEKQVITKKYLNAEILNIVAWYNNIRNNENTKHKFDALPFTVQYALRNNIKKLTEKSNVFEELRNEYSEKLRNEYFTEEKTEKYTEERDGEEVEMLRIKEEYMEEYSIKAKELDKKLYDVLMESEEINLTCYSLDDIAESIDDEIATKYGITVDDLEMLSFMNIEEA